MQTQFTPHKHTALAPPPPFAERRARLFAEEKLRQQEQVSEITKIHVQYKGVPEDCNLYMNKDLSTPHDCAKHMVKFVSDHAILAEVDGQLWDMHRPLTSDVECLKFLHFKESDPYYVNKAFWRSCSMMLGAILETAFKSKVNMQLVSFPPPNVRSGSFVYDVDLGRDWKPTREELRVLSAEMVKLSLQRLPFERITVSQEKAEDIFRDNQHKLRQVPGIAEAHDGAVTLYRVGHCVDMSRGPMMAHTGLLGKVAVVAAHQLGEHLHRVQGVALPSDILMNHFSFGILQQRAEKLNITRLPEMIQKTKLSSAV